MPQRNAMLASITAVMRGFSPVASNASSGELAHAIFPFHSFQLTNDKTVAPFLRRLALFAAGYEDGIPAFAFTDAALGQKKLTGETKEACASICTSLAGLEPSYTIVHLEQKSTLHHAHAFISIVLTMRN